MKVLHIGKYWSPRKGGIERFLEDLVATQREAGIDAYALVHGEPGATNVTSPRAADPPWLRRVPVIRELAFAPIAPSFLAVLNRAIDDWQPDYLHIHVPNVSPLLAFFSRRAKALPWVLHWHSDVLASEHKASLRWLYPFYRPLERLLVERAALVITTSNPYLETSEALHPYREKCIAIPLAIRADRLSQTTHHCTVWRDGALRLLAIGRLTYYKGFDTLIRAVAQCEKVELRIVGQGEERAALNALIAKLNVSHRVFLEGELSDDDCASRYASCDVFCLPSRERTEAFGLVLLESMSYAKPTLVSRLRGSGVIDVVQANVTGMVAEVDNPNDWSEKIRWLQHHPAQRSALGEAGRARLDARYSLPHVERAIHHAVVGAIDSDEALPEAHSRPLIVIPAKDEAPTIGEVVREIQNAGFADILVVDDQSNDGTSEAAREAGAIVLRAPLSLGAWGAMQLGIRYAVRHNYSSVITMDADGQHRAAELPRLFKAAMMVDVVIGACPSRGSRARHAAWALFRRITGFELQDLTSGFRLYNQRACSLLASEAASLLDYQDLGVLTLLKKHGLTFAEVSVQMREREHGISRIFYSWWAVVRYMIETTILAVAHR